jgi:hypothetical protein
VTPSNLEILACEPSPLGLLCLRRRELLSSPGTVIWEITLEHEYLMGSLHTVSERALAGRALELHRGGAGGGPDTGEGPAPGGSVAVGGRASGGLSVLVGGLGLGYTAREARVEVVERLRPVIDWLRRGLGPLADELNADARLSVAEGDVYEWLAGPVGAGETGRPSPGGGGRHDDGLDPVGVGVPGAWDLILIDVDHSPGEPLDPSSRWFYTEEGAARVRRHLRPGGVLGVWSAAESGRFEAALRAVFKEVVVEPVTFENRLIGEEQTDWLFLARR